MSSILDRHPAPWTEGCKRDFFDANGECFEMDKEDVVTLANELAAARAENERLREQVAALQHECQRWKADAFGDAPEI